MVVVVVVGSIVGGVSIDYQDTEVLTPHQVPPSTTLHCQPGPVLQLLSWLCGPVPTMVVLWCGNLWCGVL